ncbi:MAG: hypothetical protein WCQ21_37290, partial [Verrucomicrobiota bacterium]
TDAAVQNAFGPRETEPQFLAALDKNAECPRSNYPMWWFCKNLSCAPAILITVWSPPSGVGN